ncbi:MAG TPA: haloacid dehalogenase [Thermomicrobiales bacterium]|nr:haloacid dehalogenase [Thermomicrobiales bacterium]
MAETAGGQTEAIVRRFERIAAARDGAVGEGRQLVRLAANSVRATHRNDVATAESLLGEARGRLETLTRTLRPFPSLYWAGYVQDAAKEVAEAAITLAVVADRPLPGPEDLGVEDAAYLNALAEAASELRRQVLDKLRAGDLPRAEALLGTMDDIYSALVTVDFPDAITGGLRRTTDQLRAVLERTRGDVTIAVTQGRVERALREALGSNLPGLAESVPDAFDDPT